MAESLEFIRNAVTKGYTKLTGIEITNVGEGFAEGKIEITEDHCNPYGNVHGGVTYCLADVMGGAAFRSIGGLPVTLTSNITYLRPIVGSKVIYARAEVVRYGKTTSYIETSVYDEEMTECCKVTATYYNVEGRL